jgi:hypothetical protein
MALPFLDTNIFLRHLVQDHADHPRRATASLARFDNAARVDHVRVLTRQRYLRARKWDIGWMSCLLATSRRCYELR